MSPAPQVVLLVLGDMLSGSHGAVVSGTDTPSSQRHGQLWSPEDGQPAPRGPSCPAAPRTKASGAESDSCYCPQPGC